MENTPATRGILWLTLPTQVAPVQGQFDNSPNHYHVTLQFGVFSDEIPESVLGQTFWVRVVANCYNDRIQALSVELPEEIDHLCDNAFPHMTISMVSGVRPVESNAMLAGEHTSEPVSFELPLVCEFQPFNLP